MLITFREILRRAGARLSNTSTSTSEANDLYPKLKDWCNERYERVYESFPWRAAFEDTTLSIVASQRAYALGRDVGQIVNVFDQTNAWQIREVDVKGNKRFHSVDFDQSGNVQTADPRRYYPIGEFTVKAEVGSTAEAMSVVSSSSSDVSPHVVYIKGLVNSVELTESITITGTTAAVSSNTWDASQKLTINTGTSDASRKSLVGAITVSGNTSATDFAVIAPSEFAAQYKWIEVSPLPKSSGTQPTWEIWYRKRLQMLTNDNDIPIIDIGSALVEGMVAEGLREDGIYAEADKAEGRFVAIVNEKKAADTGPNFIEQFVPQDTDLVTTLDYSRVVTYNW